MNSQVIGKRGKEENLRIYAKITRDRFITMNEKKEKEREKERERENSTASRIDESAIEISF